MKLLAFDTSSTACSVALMMDDTIVAEHKIAPMQQAQLILSMLNKLLKENNVELNQLDAICFGRGPGSFTGVRIAASIAQGLGYAAGLPLIPISSLAALAQTVYQEIGWKKCLVAVDARINEVYWGAYEIGADQLVKLVGQEAVSALSDIAMIESKGWYGVGNGWSVYRDQIHCRPIDIDTVHLPTAAAILKLAVPKFFTQEWVFGADALPVYLRDEVAKKMR
jgi:tRNA threonylcarbamoyladenosine biosynthesis protein TsaB